MPQFRKKPVVIEAMQFRKQDTGNAIQEWANGSVTFGGDETGFTMAIKTLEGVMTANDGDWIIKGVKGEFYPCKPDIFAATYEAV